MAGDIIDEPSIVEAWLAAVAKVAATGSHNTFLAVTANTGFKATPSEVRALDGCARAAGAEKPGSVASVLFPSLVAESIGTTEERLRRGWNLFGRGRRKGVTYSQWRHTYFERITGNWMPSSMELQPIKENRLASIVGKLNDWGQDVEAAFYVHTDAPSDRLRTRGSPCLQYVQFRPHSKDRLELFALYRSHDYFHKALGNMIGLQRLGEFVAAETGRTFVRQTVFSIHPYSEASKKSLREFADCVRSLGQI